MAYSQVTGMSSTRFPLKGLSGCGCQSSGISGLGQMGWPGVFGIEPHLLAAGSFGVGLLAMHLMHRYGIMKKNPRRRSRRHH